MAFLSNYILVISLVVNVQPAHGHQVMLPSTVQLLAREEEEDCSRVLPPQLRCRQEVDGAGDQ